MVHLEVCTAEQGAAHISNIKKCMRYVNMVRWSTRDIETLSYVRTGKKNMSLLSSKRVKTENPGSCRLIISIPGKMREEIFLVTISRYMKDRKLTGEVSKNL